MIRQTGGRAVGATSTRSSPASRAWRSASAVETLPTFSSLSLIRKMGEILICSLLRKLVGMAQTPKILVPAQHAPRRNDPRFTKRCPKDTVRGWQQYISDALQDSM